MCARRISRITPPFSGQGTVAYRRRRIAKALDRIRVARDWVGMPFCDPRAASIFDDEIRSEEQVLIALGWRCDRSREGFPSFPGLRLQKRTPMPGPLAGKFVDLERRDDDCAVVDSLFQRLFAVLRKVLRARIGGSESSGLLSVAQPAPPSVPRLHKSGSPAVRSRHPSGTTLGSGRGEHSGLAASASPSAPRWRGWLGDESS